MKLQVLNKIQFIKNFLEPISKITDLAIFKIKKEYISCFCKETESAVFVYAESRDISFDGDDTEIHIKDLKRLIKIINSISENSFVLTINSNNIEYKDSCIRFKFHLIDEGIIVPPKFSVESIESSKFNTYFKLSSIIYDEMLKSSSFITDSDKIYIRTENGSVIGELNDLTKDNIDCFSRTISDFYDGDEILNPIPFSIQLFRNISTLRVQDIDVKFNTERRIIAFSIDNDKYKLKYYAAGLVG